MSVLGVILKRKKYGWCLKWEIYSYQLKEQAYRWLANRYLFRPLFLLGVSASIRHLDQENLWARENKNVTRALELDYARNSLYFLFKE